MTRSRPLLRNDARPRTREFENARIWNARAGVRSTVADGTDLQPRVWHALRAVAPGTTTTYGTLAKALGVDDPRAAIDAGAANAASPLAIVVPCHRVIARNGDLKGYAWGVHRQRWLLGHEQVPAFSLQPVA